jgi:hypothetical protein
MLRRRRRATGLESAARGDLFEVLPPTINPKPPAAAMVTVAGMESPLPVRDLYNV